MKETCKPNVKLRQSLKSRTARRRIIGFIMICIVKARHIPPRAHFCDCRGVLYRCAGGCHLRFHLHMYHIASAKCLTISSLIGPNLDPDRLFGRRLRLPLYRIFLFQLTFVSVSSLDIYFKIILFHCSGVT